MTQVPCPAICLEDPPQPALPPQLEECSQEKAGKVEVRPSNVNELRTIGQESDLLKDHWQEIASNKELMVLNPNWVRYYELEERDQFAMLAAWDGEVMVGYSVNFVFQHLHYSALTVMSNDIFYVDRDYRAGGLGVRLLNETEKLAREMECGILLFHSKPGSDLAEVLGAKLTVLGKLKRLLSPFGRLLGHRGYGVEDIIHSKVL